MTPMICRGGQSLLLIPLCSAGTACFASSGFTRLFCTSSKHSFLCYFSILLWERVLTAANRVSHRNKMSLLQEQQRVLTEGTGNVENQAAIPFLVGLMKIGFDIPWRGLNLLNVSDTKTKEMVLLWWHRWDLPCLFGLLGQ